MLRSEEQITLNKSSKAIFQRSVSPGQTNAQAMRAMYHALSAAPCLEGWNRLDNALFVIKRREKCNMSKKGND